MKPGDLVKNRCDVELYERLLDFARSTPKNRTCHIVRGGTISLVLELRVNTLMGSIAKILTIEGRIGWINYLHYCDGVMENLNEAW